MFLFVSFALVCDYIYFGLGFTTLLKTLSLSFFPVVHREGEYRINLVASNPLNNPEETSIIVYVTKLPACYPPAVTLLGLNSGKVGYNIEILDKTC